VAATGVKEARDVRFGYAVRPIANLAKCLARKNNPKFTREEGWAIRGRVAQEKVNHTSGLAFTNGSAAETVAPSTNVMAADNGKSA